MRLLSAIAISLFLFGCANSQPYISTTPKTINSVISDSRFFYGAYRDNNEKDTNGVRLVDQRKQTVSIEYSGAIKSYPYEQWEDETGDPILIWDLLDNKDQCERRFFKADNSVYLKFELFIRDEAEVSGGMWGCYRKNPHTPDGVGRSSQSIWFSQYNEDNAKEYGFIFSK